MPPVMSALFGLLAGLASLLAMMWVIVQVHRSRTSALHVVPDQDSSPSEPWWVPKQPFTVLRVLDAFDPELCMLWDSQTPALGFICEGGGCGVLWDELALIYRVAAARNPELYEGGGFQEWLRFLEDCDLVRCRADRVFITAAGAEFVTSCLRGNKAKAGEARAA